MMDVSTEAKPDRTEKEGKKFLQKRRREKLKKLQLNETGRPTTPDYEPPPPDYTVGYDPQVKLAELQRNGVVVLPVPWMDKEKRSKTRAIMLDQMARFPEFKSGATSYVMGGFSALGNPASFHNLFVRRIRQYAMVEVLPLISALIKSQDNPGEWALEQVIDRMMWRPAGLKATAESWHRDEAILAKDTDMIFGGWWNYDDVNQGFSCIPGTHTEVSGHSGFVTIKGKEANKALTDDPRKRMIVIPPGHIMIFYENLLHEVLAKARKIDQLRQFLSWRVTKEKTSLFHTDGAAVDPVGPLLDKQGVMQLKSGQTPPMYAKLHWTNWKSKIVDFTQNNMDPRTVEEKSVQSKTSKDAGKAFEVVHMNMKSLFDYGFPMYRPYSKDERSMHLPGKSWNLYRGVDDKKIQVKI
jgi:hypothetical protein